MSYKWVEFERRRRLTAGNMMRTNSDLLSQECIEFKCFLHWHMLRKWTQNLISDVPNSYRCCRHFRTFIPKV